MRLSKSAQLKSLHIFNPWASTSFSDIFLLAPIYGLSSEEFSVRSVILSLVSRGNSWRVEYFGNCL